MLHRLCLKSQLRSATALAGSWATSITTTPLRFNTAAGNTEGKALFSSPESVSSTAKLPLDPGGPSKPPQHPMERLSFVFKQHPSTLRLHRELTIALASGDAARAADLAGVLATTVRRVIPVQETTHEASSASVNGGSDGSCGGIASGTVGKANGAPSAAEQRSLIALKNVDTVFSHDVPAPTPDDVEEAVQKTREVVLHHATRSPAQSAVDGEAPSSETKVQSLPFWRDPQCLCVTVLESAFETDVPDGEAQDTLSAAGNRAAEHEAEQVRILETYLEKEGVRWKAQKAAIAKIVLNVARSLKITPEDLQSTEGLTTGRSMFPQAVAESCNSVVTGKKLNVLRHSNLVIRGEIPAVASTSARCAESGNNCSSNVEAQLAALEERMQRFGTPLTREEVQMARYELQMSQSKMRYVVGVHRELQAALDNSKSVKQLLEQNQQRANATAADSSFPSSNVTGTQFFMDELIQALNEGAEAFSTRAAEQKLPLSVEDTNAREAAENPVLPFTFMLKCCLWFDTTPSS